MKIHLMIIAVLLSCLSVPGQAGEPLKALLLTSPGVYHNYESQSQTLADAIASRTYVRFDVSVAELERWKTTDYSQGYDVLVYNICMADNQDRELIDNMRRQTEALGVPAVVIHCTMHSFRDTDDWWSLYGLKTRAHEHLHPITLSHAMEHPILQGIPADWTVAEDELYINQAFTAQALLTSAGEDGDEHTIAWLNNAGSTQIFGTTLGHTDQTIAEPVFAQLVTNGMLYVTGRLDGQGMALPGLEPVPGDAIGLITHPQGIVFLGDEGKDCVNGEFASAVGPCYVGCSLNPFKWGDAVDQCRQDCQVKLPSPDEAMMACMPES